MMSAEDDALAVTPLGRARAAIEVAEEEIAEAYEQAKQVHDLWDYGDMSLERDNESLAFVLVLDYDDGPGERASKVAHLLAPVLKKHGVARVVARLVDVDSASVGDVDDGPLPDARTP